MNYIKHIFQNKLSSFFQKALAHKKPGVCRCKLTSALTLSLSLSLSFVHAQLANWSAVLPTKFPTNASGQIHGISRVSQMKFHPSDPNKMYAVSARGGLFISNDGGNNWVVTPGTDFMSSARLASVCIDFTNDQILYLGTGDHNYYYNGNGVMKSTNGGLTFTQTSLTSKLVVDMIMDPTDNNVIVAATNSGIYKTINAGSTWTLKTASRAFDDLKQKAPTSRVLYAAGKDSSFFRSTDFGDTWNQITNGIVLPTGITNGNGVRIAVTPADTNAVYLGMVANSGLIYKSVDGGTSFTSQKTTVPPYLTYYDNSSSSSGQGDYNFGLGCDRNNANILYLVAHNNWKSTDGGVTWTQLTNWWAKCHTDMHQIITSPYNNTNLYNMNDGGVWLSTDGGSNWTPKSDGIYGYEIYHGNCSPTRKDMFSIGTQDNGELYANSTGWFTNRGGDWGSQCAFDYRTNSSMVYYYQNNKRRLVNGSDATYGLPAQVTLLNDISFHRSNPDLAFVADTFIYRTTNLTASTPAWTQIANLGKKIMAMHCAYGDANRLYVITNDGYIYVSTNALAATPTFVNYVLPNTTNNRANISTVKSSPNTVYATMNTKVYRSADAGATWTNITYNLPSVNHVKIICDEYSPSNELVFVASSNAVYYKVANAATWTIYNTNLPTRTDAIDMSIYNDSTPNSSLRFANYGRGMWETSISNLRALNANFTVDNATPCTGTAINFSDISTGSVTSRVWTFTGGTPSTSTIANPVVTYNTNGNFDVTLTIYDGLGNNSITKTSYISTNGSNLPLAEGFEGANDPPTGWKNLDNGTTGDKWAKVSTASGYGNSIYSMMFDNYSWNIPGEKDELQTMRLNMNGYNSAKLTFDVAYQVFSGYSDTLAVLVSTDCGNTFTKVYTKGGTTLSTAGSGGNNYVPAPGEWRTDTINLNGFLNQNIIVEFQNINGYGNKLYIDNVNINATIIANAGIDKTICQGSSTTIGSASVAGISYAWSPATGLTSTSISNPVASPTTTTTYIVTATQTSSGIFGKDTVLVNVNVVNATITSVSPCGGNPGSATVTVTNGTPPYSYLWNNGATTSSISNLLTGSYSVTVTGGNGCSKVFYTYLQNANPPTIILTPVATTCGLNNGSVSSTVTGGQGLYFSYLWSNGATSTSVPGVASGVYTVTVSSNGCSATASASVNASTAISVLLTPTSTTCGLNNGSITSTVSGGTNYSFVWSNGETTSSINNLSSGSYTVAVSSNGCSAIASATVNASNGVGGVSVSVITSNSATVSWNISPDAVSYNLQYKISNSGTWTVVNGIATTSYNLSALLASTPYDVQVQSNCGNGVSAWTATTTFTTGVSGCSDIYESNNTSATAKLISVGTDVSGLINPAGDIDWFKFNTTLAKPNIKVLLTNLPANFNIKLIQGTTVLGTSALTGKANEQIIYNTTTKGTYKVKVYAAATVFNASQCYTLRVDISATPSKIENVNAQVFGQGNSLSVYPNPAYDEITIVSEDRSIIRTLQLFDLAGRIVQDFNTNQSSELKLNVSSVPNGTYLMRVTTSTGVVSVKLDVMH